MVRSTSAPGAGFVADWVSEDGVKYTSVSVLVSGYFSAICLPKADNGERQRPPSRGPRGESRPRWSISVYTRWNLPRSAFLNRASLPFTEISRMIAEYRVAAGVLPPGLDQ